MLFKAIDTTNFVFSSIGFINFTRETFRDRPGGKSIVFKSTIFGKIFIFHVWLNSGYASDISFLKSTLECFHVHRWLYVYMLISATIFAGSSVLNVWLVSEYVLQISFFKVQFRICSRISVSCCYGLNTVSTS